MLKIGEHVLYYGYCSGAFHLYVFEKEKVDHTFIYQTLPIVMVRTFSKIALLLGVLRDFIVGLFKTELGKRRV